MIGQKTHYAMAEIRIFRTDTLGNSKGNADTAEDAAEDLLDQCGFNDQFDITREGRLSGQWGRCSVYDDWIAEFKEQATLTDGDVNLLVYNNNLGQGFYWSNDAALGKGPEEPTASSPGIAIVNGYISFDKTIYQNMVKHEILHTLDCDHNDATQYTPWTGRASSPLCTGYTESVRGGNDLPQKGECQEEFEGANFHSPDISDCAIDVAEGYLQNHNI